ncbi:MAG: glycoside hydrolase family 3 C-terminal domain-containing protein [Candidatus Aminicenantes bacterium]|nr:MAG: glycoside hydrolase family 3 C-terminal domain-containing protein [Candidatus Aminicenantes bacterium]
MKSGRIKPIVIVISLIFLSGSCAKVVIKPDLTLGPPEMRWAKKNLNKMTLEEKIGQMVACRYSGNFVNRNSEYFQNLKTMIVEYKIGGLIIFGGEVYESAILTNSFQELAKIPLLVASDFERGAGNQIDGATLFPPIMALGAADSEDLAYSMGKITAKEGRALGIHMTYAPVVDVNVNPDNPIINVRSVGEDPELVSRIAEAFIKGCQDFGLIATAKHFPGHGDTDLDSHSVLATIEGNRDRLNRVELFPFQRAVDAGVQAIMTAHLRIPALDPTPDLPATLSYPILTDLLRKEMGFRGLIVTDAMGMGGVTSLYTPEDAALRAVKAGVDMLLLPPTPKEVIQALIQAVRNEEIQESRIDESVKRILEAKARLGLHQNKLVDIDALDRKIGIQDYLVQAEKTFDSSMTLVKNEGDVVPLSAGFQKMAVFALSSDPGGYFAGQTFVREMKKRVPRVMEFYAEASTGDEFIAKVLEKTQEAGVVVIGLFSRLRAGKGNVGLDLRQVQMIKKLAQGHQRVVVVSFGSPYFLRHFKDVDVYLCAYRYADESQTSAVKALFGEIDIVGKLPVSIPGVFPIGHGLKVLKKSEE